MARGLRNKQRVFIEAYLTCWNASEAARRAGYKTRANTAGSQLMSNAVIAEEIKRRISELRITPDEILARLAEQARGEQSKYILADGSVDIGKMKEDDKLHLIKSITPMKEGNKIEFYDGQSALVHLGKAIGALKDNVHDGEVILRVVYGAGNKPSDKSQEEMK